MSGFARRGRAARNARHRQTRDDLVRRCIEEFEEAKRDFSWGPAWLPGPGGA